MAEYWIPPEIRTGSLPKLKIRPAPRPMGKVTLLPPSAFQLTVTLGVMPIRLPARWLIGAPLSTAPQSVTLDRILVDCIDLYSTLPSVLKTQGPGVHVRRACTFRDGIRVGDQATKLRRQHETQAGTEQAIFLFVVLPVTIDSCLAASTISRIQGSP
ncbi:hypothetical protein D3C72_1929930 [compost metagenome]